jgi:two-component system sensor histidine kinase KdpD
VTGALAELKLDAARVRLEIPDDLPALFVDADLIGQALKQLLDNADRYSPRDTPIAISARLVEDSIEVSVADSGPGVTPDEQSRIFDKFYRGRHSVRFPDGTGMGLSIAKGIIEAHGGRISVFGRPEGGTIFSLRLPLNAEQVRHE